MWVENLMLVTHSNYFLYSQQVLISTENARWILTPDGQTTHEKNKREQFCISV